MKAFEDQDKMHMVFELGGHALYFYNMPFYKWMQVMVLCLRHIVDLGYYILFLAHCIQVYQQPILRILLQIYQCFDNNNKSSEICLLMICNNLQYTIHQQLRVFFICSRSKGSRVKFEVQQITKAMFYLCSWRINIQIMINQIRYDKINDLNLSILLKIYFKLYQFSLLTKSFMFKNYLILLLLIVLTSSFQLSKKLQKTNAIEQNLQVAFVGFFAIYPDQKLQAGDTIYIRGDSCNLTWNKGVPLNHSQKNQWSTMLACELSIKSNIKFLLNDKIWMLGPNYWFIVNARANLTIYPSFHPAINPVYDTKQIKSAILNNSRKCSIYLPPSYNDNTLKKYPVLLMHDGQNLFDPNKAAFGTAWKIQDTINDLIGKQKISQMIVVGIWNTNQRNNEYTYSYDKQQGFGGKGDQYLDFIQKQLIPVIQKEWFPSRVINDYGYAIGGSSLGGLISCYAVYKRPTVFRVGICMSSSFWWNNQDFNNVFITNYYNTNTVLYLDSGDSGPSQDSKNQTLRVKEHFQKIGYNKNTNSTNLYYYLDKGGQHNEYYWGKRFNIPLQYLYGN